jgi:hypothetical protein
MRDAAERFFGERIKNVALFLLADELSAEASKGQRFLDHLRATFER